MRILLATSEVHPFSKTGGLADMVGALAKYLAGEGHEVGVVSPYYRCVRKGFPDIQPFDWKIDLPHGATQVQAKAKILKVSENLRYYFIVESNFYDREGIYQSDGVDYNDNADRFIFFSKCVAHMARYLPWKPELVHAHDWQSGLVPLFIKYQTETDGWEEPPALCLTIHNLAFHGSFPPQYFSLTNLPEEYFTPTGIEFYGKFNCLKAGILFSDLITTVSPKYAEEIKTKAYGCGLEGVLRTRQSVLRGVLNGVDYQEWNTDENPQIEIPYAAGKMRGKAVAKSKLQKEFGLPASAKTPLFGNISRLADQKGSDLLLEVAEKLVKEDLQFVFLGSGLKELEVGFQDLADRYPKKVAVKIGYDHQLAHRIEAGSDFFLMPSRFEPCGLNQLYSLRYGAIPVVRRTGGLEDTIVDLNDDPKGFDGIKFDEPTVKELKEAILRAVALFKDKPKLRKCRTNGMLKDFSWEKTAKDYSEIYQLTKDVAALPAAKTEALD